MVGGLEDLFPGLRGSGYRITSPALAQYNCIAWAVGDTENWWEPDRAGLRYWPAGFPREDSLATYTTVFAALGYTACEGEEVEAGVEKIALFAGPDGRPTHAARQLPNGRWTSKVGQLEDLEHALHDLAGEEYGQVVLLMKRPASTVPSPG